MSDARVSSLLDRVIRFCLEQKLVVAIALVGVLLWGVLVAPFSWDLGGLPRDPVPVDAIPDIGENQQIVFTEWPGRSPQDIDDQISYPLTVALLGMPGVKDIRNTVEELKSGTLEKSVKARVEELAAQVSEYKGKRLNHGVDFRFRRDFV